jgi:putative oxidoreductase
MHSKGENEMNRLILWTLTIAAAAMFLLAGALKLAGVAMEVQLFAALGLGQWFRYFTGLLEVGGAIGLFVPAAAPFAALTLATVMVGAIITHLFVIGGSPLIPIALLAASIAIAYLRRDPISGVLLRRRALA